MKKNMKLTLNLLALPLGVFFIVFGGYDDSPGLQFIGLLVVIYGVAGVIGRAKRRRIK